MAIEEVLERFNTLLITQDPEQRLIFRPDETAGDVRIGVEIHENNHWIEDSRWTRRVCAVEAHEGVRLLEKDYCDALRSERDNAPN
jgi:hypothetical protein